MQGRKRVVAREVREVEAANRASAALDADVFTPAPPAAPDSAVVIDPSTLGRRYRRTSHNKVYRWTQFCTTLAALLAGVAIVCTMVDEILPARACAGPAVALGLVATYLSGRTSLSARWRGWAIAALVFAAAALSLTWIQPALTREDPADLTRPRQQAPQ